MSFNEPIHGRVIPFTDDYSVTDDGRVFRIVGGNVQEARYSYHPAGYPQVCMWLSGAPRRRYVHRLVICTWLGPAPTPKHEVRHLDGNPKNNRLENLAWGTHRENVADMMRHGRHATVSRPDRVARGPRNGNSTKPASYPRGERVYNAKLTDEIVREARQMVASGFSISEAARRVGRPRNPIKMAVHRKTWRHVT